MLRAIPNNTQWTIGDPKKELFSHSTITQKRVFVGLFKNEQKSLDNLWLCTLGPARFVQEKDMAINAVAPRLFLLLLDDSSKKPFVHTPKLQ